MGAVLGGILGVELAIAIWQAVSAREPIGGASRAAATQAVSSVRTIGQVLFTDYAFAFEVTSLLILVAMVGAVVLAKREG